MYAGTVLAQTQIQNPVLWILNLAYGLISAYLFGHTGWLMLFLTASALVNKGNSLKVYQQSTSKDNFSKK